MSDSQVTLLDNATATGSAVQWPGGSGMVTVEGTFSGATIKLQVKSRNGTWIDVGASVEFTANGAGGFTLPAGEIRMAVSGGPPSSVFAYAVVVDRGRS